MWGIHPKKINSSGQVVGYYAVDPAAGESHAFLWSSGGGMQDLGTLGGTDSFAQAINDQGQIVGGSKNASGEAHAFLWSTKSGMQDLSSLVSDSDGAFDLNYIRDINNSGEIIGDRDSGHLAWIMVPTQ